MTIKRRNVVRRIKTICEQLGVPIGEMGTGGKAFSCSQTKKVFQIRDAATFLAGGVAFREHEEDQAIRTWLGKDFDYPNRYVCIQPNENFTAFTVFVNGIENKDGILAQIAREVWFDTLAIGYLFNRLEDL